MKIKYDYYNILFAEDYADYRSAAKAPDTLMDKVSDFLYSDPYIKTKNRKIIEYLTEPLANCIYLAQYMHGMILITVYKEHETVSVNMSGNVMFFNKDPLLALGTLCFNATEFSICPGNKIDDDSSLIFDFKISGKKQPLQTES